MDDSALYSAAGMIKLRKMQEHFGLDKLSVRDAVSHFLNRFRHRSYAIENHASSAQITLSSVWIGALSKTGFYAQNKRPLRDRLSQSKIGKNVNKHVRVRSADHGLNKILVDCTKLSFRLIDPKTFSFLLFSTFGAQTVEKLIVSWLRRSTYGCQKWNQTKGFTEKVRHQFSS